MPMGQQIVPPPGSHVLHRPWVGLQSVIVAFLDHTHLLFFIVGYMQKILSETIKSI